MTDQKTIQPQTANLASVSLLAWRWSRLQAEKRQDTVHREILRRMH